MKSAIASILLATLTVACSPPRYPVPAGLQDNVSTFQALYGKKFENVSYAFGSLPYPALAQCLPYSDHGEITIDRSSWDERSAAVQRSILFHELGHCVLHRGHRDDTDSDGYPVSIMNSYELSDRELTERYDGLVSELFSHLSPMLSANQIGIVLPAEPSKGPRGGL
jgi:hypothetical protein